MLTATKPEVIEREALRVNPAKTCQPVGAMYAALGIHKCMPHSHGSQGCCSYHRSHLTRHHKEPVMATTSSFTEGASVFGGLSNLTTALDNIFSLYKPDVVAVHTTCLSEVIGDDIPMIAEKYKKEGKLPEGKFVIHANTPSFVGSHVTGFSNMVAAMVKYFSKSSDRPLSQLNIVPGYVEPSDMRELHRILKAMAIGHVMFPDTSGVLDAPQTGTFEMYPAGGTTVPQLISTGDSYATIALGEMASTAAATLLEKQCKVPFKSIDLPIGLGKTDEFLQTLRHLTGKQVPADLELERGQLLDMMTDMAQYFYNKKVAIFGDPDHVLSMVQFCVELDLKPTVVVTGTQSKAWENRIFQILEGEVVNPVVRSGGDIHFLHQNIKMNPVDLFMGNTYGKYVARAEDNIPFVRFGWPILDRVGHRAFSLLGYRGSLRLIEKITDALFDKKDRECAEEWFELVM